MKPEDDDRLEKLPMRPIISNIGTATHKTARYLCNLLAPLGKSTYTVESTKDFVNKIKKINIPRGYNMISFDVVSLFTNVPLQQTIDIILRKVYDEKLIRTNIRRENMKELLLLCTQGVPFTFNDDIYMQVDGVMMGSPLGALFANIYMCELENTIIPQLESSMKNWTRYVDDTFAFVKPGEENNILEILNSYHPSIKFTYDMEQNSSIPFLDVLIKKAPDGKIQTSVYRKTTNTDIYMNWMSHAPTTWKIATLKSLIKRAFLVSSTETALEEEIRYLENVFCNHNDYPIKLVKAIIKNERINQLEASKSEGNEPQEEEEVEEQEEDKVNFTINLPYAGDKGQHIMSKVHKYIVQATTKGKKNVRISTTYKSRTLGTCFAVKDKTKFEHIHNVVYHSTCPNKKCVSHYAGQTKCRIGKRAMEHRETDKIIGKGYKTDFKRKISESIHVKKLKPDLNVQKDSYKLSLFN